MKSTLQILGRFSMLPTEIRLIIWEFLISSIHRKSVLPKANPLSILCTSRYFYNEISSHIFNNSVQVVLLNPEYCKRKWMVIRLKSRTVDIQWVLRNRTDTESHFHNFPHSKTTMEVHIHAPDPTDPGQLVLIWKKVSALVDLVIPITRPDIELVPKGSWHSREPPAHWRADRGLFYEMGGLQESIKPLYRYRPDQDIVMLPFLRLELWNEDPAKNMPAMSDQQFDNLHRRLMGLFNRTGIELRLEELHTMTQDTAAIQIEEILVETNLFLETSLDETPGRTADFLRLARYKSWFRDGDTWESPYENQLRDQLYTSPFVVANTDPWLRESNRRYILLILLHHAIHAFRSSSCDGLGVYHQVIYMSWDSGMWSDVFPAGIPPLSNVQVWLSRFWSDKFQFRTFHVYSDWLGQQGTIKNGAGRSKCLNTDCLSL